MTAGGSSGVGGSSAGFAGTAIGGTAGSSGAASGGAGGGAIRDCFPHSDDNACSRCAQEQCCFELVGCAMDQACEGDGEATCIQGCVQGEVADGGVTSEAVVSRCAALCAAGTVISPATNDLIGCLLNGARADGGTGQDCYVECFSGDF